jgi:NAD(P)-dependent dehydrogenase (short-subunit alcohol dehydrogenase family)
LEEGVSVSASNPPEQRIIVLGALSTIAEATARRLAAQGARLLLAGRDALRLTQVANDLKVRGAAEVLIEALDLAEPSDIRTSFHSMVDALGGEIDAVLLFYGVLGDQRLAENDGQELDRILRVNFSSAAAWCMEAANVLERQRHGVLVAISSVAGDRGRQSNYAYGAAKAGLSVFVQGLAHRLAPTGARAVLVKLGFVDTAMTRHIPKSGPLWAKPDAIAARLVAIVAQPARPVVYLPWYWRPIMFVVRALPASIFHKTRL